MAKRKLYIGWGIRGRPFSRAEYMKSYIRKNTKASYAKYLRGYAVKDMRKA